MTVAARPARPAPTVCVAHCEVSPGTSVVGYVRTSPTTAAPTSPPPVSVNETTPST
ncbi:hypothetical protein BJ983_005225 [Actinomycetospora corticicola]|uniref:Uncharacterized protein n=1 Tax=Actinomycetospora corticicola TaxID=663602 RepID=A0A7Y9E0X9_9PSEU|nr:hypothetical protein [Actinomycetospora corticicola]